ncbi:MAG: hypothetical protein KatS3mg130_0243 [Candidatus Sumerlaea sp.]|nr:MAG: hypothetical protein KatS3mg130_0243 [Candidatus Sumerlaea sp.]
MYRGDRHTTAYLLWLGIRRSRYLKQSIIYYLGSISSILFYALETKEAVRHLIQPEARLG